MHEIKMNAQTEHKKKSIKNRMFNFGIGVLSIRHCNMTTLF